MAYEEDPIRQAQINVSVAANITAQLAAGQGQDDPVDYFVNNLAIVGAAIAQFRAEQLAGAGLGAVPVQQATDTTVVPFPGHVHPSQVPTSAPSHVHTVQAPASAYPAGPPAYAHAHQSAAQPAAVPGGASSPDETLWNQFFADPGAWYNNATDKRSTAAPDFRHKQLTDSKGRGIGLWIDSKGTPAWVRGALVQRGLIPA